ncbi:hypothetical protein P154DRAFT_521369 [Amniculicola lignicola CBS 123094]|uniref:Plus3 domain-containing protein n=1 Tax=Amniculicola lignicola CBS 123094 TaxID=1392246 RepID=A0A6A5WKB5_9PLEO|nr:hypothetical protein P154DRAFT_521369 [Amniculicola lignicola CBS 123094]
MSDIDDELFALAGGDEEAEVEEGEASEGASSPNSIGSGAMDESDSDSDGGNDDNDRSSYRDPDVPYPLEGQFVDRKDREHIMSLPQLQRERILGERSEEMNKAKFAADLRHRAKQMEKSAADGPRKRKASSLEPEDANRKSSRQKVKVKTNDKLEAYKREREQRGQQRERHNDRRDGHRRSSSEDRKSDSEVDAEGESEVDWDEGAKKVVREELPASLHDFESIRLGRTFISKVCFWPQFDESITGAFVRVGVSQLNGRTQYKMAQIKGELHSGCDLVSY